MRERERVSERKKKRKNNKIETETDKWRNGGEKKAILFVIYNTLCHIESFTRLNYISVQYLKDFIFSYFKWNNNNLVLNLSLLDAELRMRMMNHHITIFNNT